MTVIERPGVNYDDATHTYTDPETGEAYIGVSSAAKVGSVSDAWGIASAWGFRIGYEGACDVYLNGASQQDKDDMRERLKKAGLTPWSNVKKAQDRGTWVHDLLESLAATGSIPADLLTADDERRLHAQSVLRWYVAMRPSFVATEVQVVSQTHRFAGRYDIRALIPADRLVDLFEGHDSPQAARVRTLADMGLEALCLIDLKTTKYDPKEPGKGIYPTQHFPQLAGYELASVEMGFPPTDAQFILHSHSDGSRASLHPSWSEPSDFVAYVEALRAIRRIESADPERKLQLAREQAILSELVNGPASARELAERLPELDGLDGRAVGFILGGLRKRGLVEQPRRLVWALTKMSESGQPA